MQKRSKSILLRLTENELEDLNQMHLELMTETGKVISLADFIRQRIFKD